MALPLRLRGGPRADSNIELLARHVKAHFIRLERAGHSCHTTRRPPQEVSATCATDGGKVFRSDAEHTT